MARTYLPTLVFVGKKLLAYCVRYDDTIRKNMSTEVQALYDALLAALTALLGAIEIEMGD